FSSRRRHTRFDCDWSSDVCSSDLNIGGVQIDQAVTQAFIAALEPAKLTAALAAAEHLEADREALLKQWRLAVERATYEAQRAERSEERRVGKEWRKRGRREQYKKN